MDFWHQETAIKTEKSFYSFNVFSMRYLNETKFQPKLYQEEKSEKLCECLSTSLKRDILLHKYCFCDTGPHFPSLISQINLETIFFLRVH